MSRGLVRHHRRRVGPDSIRGGASCQHSISSDASESPSTRSPACPSRSCTCGHTGWRWWTLASTTLSASTLRICCSLQPWHRLGRSFDDFSRARPGPVADGGSLFCTLTTLLEDPASYCHERDQAVDRVPLL